MKNWQPIGKDILHRIGRRQVVERRFQDSSGEEIEFALYHEGNTVCTLVVTPEDEVVLVRQFRPGPEMVLDELPGGGIEEGEDAYVAARREVLEEVGYEGTLIFLGRSFTCAYSTRVRFHFLMLRATRVAAPRNDADEEQQGTEVVIKTRDEFIEQARQGLLTDGETAFRALRHLGW